MAIKKELIQFTISNETDCSINLPLFQQNVYSINATTKYSWDITSEVLACGTGTIVVNGNTLTLNFTPTLTGLLNALNALGFGFFCTETIGGSTFLYVVDDTNVYGGLDLCPSASTTTTTSTTTAAPATTTTTTTTTTAAPTSTTTTTSTTTAAPTTSTTTTTTTSATQFNLDFRIRGLSATSQQFKIWYSTDFGATWTFWVQSIGSLSVYPAWDVYAGLVFNGGQTIYVALTDLSDNDVQYGEGQLSADFTSLCGKSNPFIVPNISASTIGWLNLNVSGSNFVNCPITTTTTTSTTTAAPTSTTTTTSTTTAAPTSTTTTTSTTTAPETTTTTTTSTTTTAPETTTTTTTSTTTLAVCASATIVITQSDIDNADDGTVHAVFTACNGGGVQDVAYSIAGTYPNDVCYDTNFDTVPTFYYIQGGNPIVTGNPLLTSYATYSGACGVTTTTTTSTTTILP